jgi:methylated-DNA-[protein]-cysteine S-methyltransferase
MKLHFSSPIGIILVEGTEKGISKLVFLDEMTSQEKYSEEINIENEIVSNSANDEMTSQWQNQLDGYFRRTLKSFDIELDLQGTEFQRRVWAELIKIPFGKTVTYKELTKKLGNIKAIRAVAAANGANPVSIIVPCHRVIGSDGSLTGYAGGLWRKQWLLDFERDDVLF